MQRQKIRDKFATIPFLTPKDIICIEKQIHTLIHDLVKHQTKIKPNIVNRLYIGKAIQIFNLLNPQSYLQNRIQLPKDPTTVPNQHYKSFCKAKWELLQPDLELLDKTITHDTSNIYTTSTFQCGSCKQHKCIYHEIQLRSCDENSTIMVRCLNCGFSFHA